jgi:hypothetical protein
MMYAASKTIVLRKAHNFQPARWLNSLFNFIL